VRGPLFATLVALVVMLGCGHRRAGPSLPGPDARTQGTSTATSAASEPPPPEPLPMAALESIPLREPVRSVAAPDDAKVAVPESPAWFLEDDGLALVAAGKGAQNMAVRVDASGVAALDADSASPYFPAELPAHAESLPGWTITRLDPFASAARLRVALGDDSHLRLIAVPSESRTPHPPPNGPFFRGAEVALFRPKAEGGTGFTKAWATRVDQAGRPFGITADGKYWAVAASKYPDPPFSAWVVVGDMREGRILWQTPETRAPGLHVRFEVLGDAEAVVVGPAAGGCTGFYPRQGQPVLVPGPGWVSNVAGDRVYVLVSVEPGRRSLLVAYDIHGRPIWRAPQAHPWPETGHRRGLVASESGQWVANLDANPVPIFAAR